jgi:hypothetical protein
MAERSETYEVSRQPLGTSLLRSIADGDKLLDCAMIIIGESKTTPKQYMLSINTAPSVKLADVPNNNGRSSVAH